MAIPHPTFPNKPAMPLPLTRCRTTSSTPKLARIRQRRQETEHKNKLRQAMQQQWSAQMRLTPA